MRKKWIQVIACGMILTLTACGMQENKRSEDYESNDGKMNAGTVTGEAGFQEFQKTASIEETILYNSDDILITATELGYTDYSADISVVIENNSEKDLTFISNSIGYSCNSVNGYMIADGYINSSVAAGKKANETLSLSYDMLRLYGIFEIADIEIGFDISDDEYNHIYTGPCQVRTSIADQYDYQRQSYRETVVSDGAAGYFGYTIPYFSDKALYDQGGIKVASSLFMEKNDDGSALLLEVENNAEESVRVTMADIYLNGLGVYSGTWSSKNINPGKKGILDLDFSTLLADELRDAYGIQSVGTVTLTMEFENQEGEKIGDPATITVENSDVVSEFSQEGEEVYNSDSIRIVMKGVIEEDSEYSGDMYVLLMVENKTSENITITDVYDSLAVNGYMMDSIISPVNIKGGSSAIMKIQLWQSDLEENSIEDISDISQVEIGIQVMQGDHIIEETKLDMSI